MSKTMKSNKMLKRIASFVLALALCFGVFTPMSADAAAAKTGNRINYVMKAESLFKAFDMYGRDKFKVTYDGKKVINCTATQENKNLGTKMCEKGGIKLTKKTTTVWTYQSKWYLNVSLLPSWLLPIAKKVTPVIGQLSDLGRLCTCTTTYTIDRNGTLKVTGRSVKWQVPSKLQSAARKLTSYFSPWF